MPRLTTLVLGFIAAILCGSLFASTDSQLATQSLNRVPLSFTKNMGQWDDRVLFHANSGGATMWFTKEGVTYQFTRRIDNGNTPLNPLSRGDSHLSSGTSANEPIPLLRGVRGVSDRDSIEQLILTAKFLGANPNPEIIAEGQMEYKCNYFLGNDPSKWHTDVPNYEAITIKGIYPGIDLKYSGDGNGQAAYEFVAAPGADIAQIRVAYEGAEETSLDADGKLILKTKWGDMTAAIKSPLCASLPLGEGSGVRAILSGSASCAWWTSSSTTSSSGLAHGDVRQALAEKSGTLTLSYSTYLGGTAIDGGEIIAVDGSGNAYVAGETNSSNFPTLNPYQTLQGSTDVFVTKLSSSGNSVTYSTYVGGGNDDYGYGIAVDGNGSAYVTGRTNSSDFPTLNPFQTYQNKDDIFVTKLSSSGNQLIYSTNLGGGSDDWGCSIAVDGSGHAYVTGMTLSSNFPTLNPYQTDQGGADAFVTELSSSGTSLIYSTYLGGGGTDVGYDIAVNGNGNAYLTGRTESSNFPTSNPYQMDQGGADGFVTKLSNDGNSLIYSTYLGGASNDEGDGIAVDVSGNAYVTGGTWSSDFPTLNPCQTDQRGADVFVTKLSNAGNGLIYSTYLGGGDTDIGFRIAVDIRGNACVTGGTWSSDFPTLNPYQADQGAADAFVTKLSSSGNSLIYSTYLGGSGTDDGLGIAVDGSGDAYVTGFTGSFDFPTLNPYQMRKGGDDAFVTKLNWAPDYDCGDVNTDEQIDLLDAVFLINYIFVGGPAPEPLSVADVDCSGRINIADVVRLINYIFRAGPAPCTGCD